MIKQFFLGTLVALTLVGCDSMAQMTVERSTPLAPQIEATESITVVGSNTSIAFLFSQGDIPSEILNGSHPKVMLGGHPVPLLSAGPGQIQAALPPSTSPPTPDLAGNTVLLFQSDSGARLVPTHLTVKR